jgi:ATP-binding cassette subfamily B protein
MKDAALRWLWAVPGKKKLNILFLAAAQALHGASGVLYALLLRDIVDSAAAHDGAGFRRFLAALIGLAAVQLALRAVIRWLTELSKATMENIFKERLTDTLLHKDFLRVSAVHSGEWLNRLTNDAKVAADGYTDIVPGLAGMAVKLVSALVMILVLEPRFASVFIPGGAALMLFTWLFRRRLKTLHRHIQEADGRLRVFLQERIGAMVMIRSFAAEEQTRREAGEKMLAHKAARMRRNRFSNLANIGFGAAMSGMYLLGVGWCGFGILKGTVSFGTLTAVTQLITQIQTPFANITGFLPRYYAMLASAERLMEAESFAGDGGGAKPLAEMTAFYENELSSIGLEDVSFTYYPAAEDAGELSKDDMPVVLERLSLEIKKGETVAFTGHSGCGKTTALRLLMSVYEPDGGRRYYTGQNGERVSLSSACRRLFAYVPQGCALMNGTIREIVGFAEPDAARDEARLGQALRIACAYEFVSELADGADTLLGERGAGLSEGQMQRLAIARALFSGSPILLLDEATAALDTDTERRLLQNLRTLTDKTVVIVTHRPAALTICDRVLEFTENGVICRDR